MYGPKKIVLAFISVAVLFVFSLCGFFKDKYVVPIFMYHQVIPKIDPKNKLTVSVKGFEKQMHFLKRQIDSIQFFHLFYLSFPLVKHRSNDRLTCFLSDDRCFAIRNINGFVEE